MKKDIVLLGILSGGDFYGYEIMKIVRTVMPDITPVSTGSLYYRLRALQEKGLVSSTVEREGQRPRRYRYTITDTGKEIFRNMALDNIVSADRAYWPFMSSVFFFHHLPVPETIAALGKRIKRMKNDLGRIEKIHQYMKENDYPVHFVMIAGHGLRHLKADIEWMESLSAHIEKGEGDSSRIKALWDHYMKSAPLKEKGQK